MSSSNLTKWQYEKTWYNNLLLYKCLTTLHLLVHQQEQTSKLEISLTLSKYIVFSCGLGIQDYIQELTLSGTFDERISIR